MNGDPSFHPAHRPDERPVALVTGASRGIGRVVALRLAALGFDVSVNFHRSRAEAQEVADAVHRVGGRATIIQADMADPRQARDLVSSTVTQLGRLDVVINNAGITRDRLLVQMTAADWDATWLTDLSGPRATCTAALDVLAENGGGRIVNVGSVVGSTGNAGQANYAAAKSALLGLTRELAVMAAAAGTTVNCVVPGYIITDATAHLSGEQQKAWIERIPMKRSAVPDEVAEAILFFAAGSAAYITGQCLAVDGGLLAAAGKGWGS